MAARAAHLREGVRTRRLDDRGGGRRQGQDLRTGRSASGRRRSRPGRRRASPCRRCCGLQHAVADKLVFTKIRDRWAAGSGTSSPAARRCRRDIAEWFHAAGLLILEGYGLTETGAGTCVNLPGRTTGSAPSARRCRAPRSKIAEDGEILVRGPGVMRGYHNLPEQTAEVCSADGWFATGDIGEIDDGGRLRITDRKKDLIKTSGGKYIAPQPIEAHVQGALPAAEPDGRRARRGPQLRHRARHARPRRAVERGPRRKGLPTARPEALVAGIPRSGSRYGMAVEELNARPQPLGDHQGLPDPRARPLRRGRRAHAQPEGQAPGRRERYAGVLDSMYTR